VASRHPPAVAASEPQAEPESAPESEPKSAPGPGDLVDLHDVDPTIALDIRYATADNFTGVAIYPVARCLLRRSVADRLARAQRELRQRGLGLLVWDCYRPISVQERFAALVSDPRYVAPVVRRDGVVVAGSRHNRGAAVDLTLVDRAGVPLTMPTHFDDFSTRAHRDDGRGSVAARRHRDLLTAVMAGQGFVPLATEWWHFDDPDWASYPLDDRPLQ
jgi:beta-N-acetylhexosaminidase/D-alanyl-D-alanine dipeptidase